MDESWWGRAVPPNPPCFFRSNRILARYVARQLETTFSDSLAAMVWPCHLILDNWLRVGVIHSTLAFLKREWAALRSLSHFLWAGKWMWCWKTGINQAEDGSPPRKSRAAWQKEPGPGWPCGTQLYHPKLWSLTVTREAGTPILRELLVFWGSEMGSFCCNRQPVPQHKEEVNLTQRSRVWGSVGHLFAFPSDSRAKKSF